MTQTTDCIEYTSSTVSNKLDTLFCNLAEKTVLYEDIPIFSTPILPNSLFITESNLFADIFLSCDYKTFNDKAVIAYFKDGKSRLKSTLLFFIKFII